MQRHTKHRLLWLATLLVALTTLSLTGCKQHQPDTMDRDEKLLLLDAKIKQHPKDASLYYERARVELDLQQVNNAIDDLKQAIELDDKKVDYYTTLGDAYFRNGKVEDSYRALNKALDLDDDNLEALSKMGEILFYSKDYDRAMETLNKVTAHDPDNRTAFMLKGFMYKEQGDTTNAVHYFRRVIDLYPDFEPAYEELGVMYAQQKNPLGAEYLNTAIQLEPDNLNALYALAMLYQDLELADKANEIYVKMLEIDPQNQYAWNNRGWMELVLYEDYDAAIDFFTKAIDANNQYVEAYYNRALAYELKGDKTNATIGYKTALQLDPDYEPAQQRLADLQ